MPCIELVHCGVPLTAVLGAVDGSVLRVHVTAVKIAAVIVNVHLGQYA